MSDSSRECRDPIGATAWLHEAVPSLEGDDVAIHAELSDVDEVALIVKSHDDEQEFVIVHLPRVQAIALAGQLAAAATTPQTALPRGHGPTGPLV